MLKKTFSIVLVILIISCSATDKYWDISKFQINKTALGKYEKIKLLYSSRDPEHNNNRNYYIHVVVVSEQTGDTVNILTNSDNNFQQEDGNKVFNFLPNEDPLKVPVTYKKVARDPKFDQIADNHFPAIIGSIGEYFPNNGK